MKFKRVAFGGTFDIPLHKGHKKLIKKAFDVGDFCLIGLTSDKFVKKLLKEYAEFIPKYRIRYENIVNYLNERYKGRYKIVKLDKFYTEDLMKPNKIQALVVSEETYKGAKMINDLRKEKKLKPLKIIKIKMVLAEDGKPISSTRIRKGEIDSEGRILK
jgi:pantetheine-phosphate adenylyltransferase